MVLAVRPELVRGALARRLPPAWIDVKGALAGGRTTFREMNPKGRDSSAGPRRRAPKPAAQPSSSAPG
jgi:hypothetical protein